MEMQVDIFEMRLQRLEQMNNTLVDSSASMSRILQAQAVRFDRIERRLNRMEERLDKVEERLDKLEEQMAQVMVDVAFIRNYLETKGMN